jgi:serine/threonine protein kinase
MIPPLLEGRFEIESQLSTNDFSRVYLACDRHYLHRPECVITAIPYYQPEIRHRLEREAQHLERLGHHPQVPSLLAYFYHPVGADDWLGEVPSASSSALSGTLSGAENRLENVPASPAAMGGTFFLVHSHIAGHPLSQELTLGKRLSEGYVTKLLKDVLVPLSYAHEKGLVHQNLHPHNLIREARDGQIFLSDFGAIAKVARSKFTPGASPDSGLDDDPEGLLSSSIPVSPNPYSAPETLAGNAEPPRPASDLYSLGLIAIEALTGQRHQDFAYDPGRGIQWRAQAEASLPLAEFIDRLLRQDWRDRFANAQEALATFKAQNARQQIANDSRMPTVVAAPGSRGGRHRPQMTQPAGVGGPQRSQFGLARSAGRSPNGTPLSLPTPSGTLSTKQYAPNPYLFKLAAGSIAAVIALGVAVKTYQWGEYRLSQLPQSWQRREQTATAYEPASTQSLTPLLKDGSILLQPAAAEAFWQMVAAAQADGIALYPISGYVAESSSAQGSDNDYVTGYGVDIGGEEAALDRQGQFAQSEAFKWLKSNAKDHGFELSAQRDRQKSQFFVGTFVEPWHWRYVGDAESQQVFAVKRS